jgi:long-chain acyl-CoA synthetase
LYQRARTSPNGVAFIVGHDRWQYGRLAAQVERLARGLFGRGIRKRDRVALHMSNRPEFVIAVYACFHVGAVAVPMNGKMDAVELKWLLEFVRPALYVGDANLYSKLDAIDYSILPRDKRFVVGDIGEDKGVQPWANLFGDSSVPLPILADVDSPAVAVASAETTGAPHCVIHTHATLAALFSLPFMSDGR